MSSSREVVVGDLTVDDLWDTFKAFIEETGLARQHLDSYNRLVTEEIEKIIMSVKEIRPQMRLTMGRRRQRRAVAEELRPDVKLVIKKVEFHHTPLAKEQMVYDKPVTPMECRIRGITYSVPLRVEMALYRNGNLEKEQKVRIADFPVMIRSVLDPIFKLSRDQLIEYGEDPEDPGGYFIINGSEKVIVAQEDLAVNRIIAGPATTATAKITHTAKAVSTVLGIRRQIIVDRMSDGTIEASLSRLRHRIPVVILLRALGLEKDVEIMMAVSPRPEIQMELLPSIEKANALAPSRIDALRYIGNRLAPGQPEEVRIRRAEEFLDTQLLPHLGMRPEDRKKKAFFIAEMVNRVLQLYLGMRAPDDKDFLGNKRLRLAGDLIAELFREALEALVNNIAQKLEEYISERKPITNLGYIVRSDIITDRLRSAIATGNWGQDRTGISQQLDRTNWISVRSHLRRVVSPLSRGQAHFEARDLHGSHWGRLCPFETPEGVNCGLVKNLALMAYISVGVDESKIEKLLYEKLGVERLEDLIEEAVKTGVPPEIMLRGSKVFLNGRPIGYHPNGEELARRIRELRRRGELPVERAYEVSVFHLKEGEIDEVYINTDAGRLMRPVVVVENGKPKLTREHVEKLRRGELKFWDLVKMGIIELLDPEEEANAYIAQLPWEVTKEHTHMELWPAAIVGVSAATIPYLEHNQSPRNTYQAAMAKQALGVYALNFKLRMDSHSYLLQYPQKPIVQTRMLDAIGYNRLPAGQNMVVAIMAYTGYNIEDALVFNKGALDMGLARAYFFRVYSTVEYEYPGGARDEIKIPDPTEVADYKGADAYKKLAPDGIVEPETEVVGGDVLIAKKSPPRFLGDTRATAAERRYKDTSVTLRHGEKGVVDMVMITTTIEKNRMVKVRVRDLRIPEIGDKFASRHGQKGVIGMILPRYDMPYTEEGIEPEVILNPHAIPSRMTVGQLLEEIAGKIGAIEARYVDATPFFKEPIEGLRISLVKAGYHPDALEVMYDGRTGRMIERMITIGITYYQRLYHMVADKIHARATGKVHLLTRQPTEGKARQGGLRFGEMERDCLVGHGAAMMLRDRMLENSDVYIMYVCNECGNIAWYNARKGKLECPIHGENADIRAVKVPYAFKLLIQEITSMMIKPEIKAARKLRILDKIVL